ncbi:MAG: winged helix-turn-helix domain-containing protein [Anaerolineae bacterium]|nr:winged helix-turn-helix domain-containing protein [Anaerolineae bacterium]
MAAIRSLRIYEDTYRTKEIKLLANWILAGESGTVVGLPGCGRSNLLSFFCHRPEIVRSHLPEQAQSFVVVPVELNDLLVNEFSAFYRIILRAFARVTDLFPSELQSSVTALYEQHQREQDFFVSQSAVYDVLKLCQRHQVQVVLVLNRFEDFCHNATIQMINALRALRDNFKDSLCYIVGMPQQVTYLPDPSILGNMYEILDSRICWVGAMAESDARQLVFQETYAATVSPTDEAITKFLTLTGHFPALLKAVCQWWLTESDRPAMDEWLESLLVNPTIQHRLAKIWYALSQEEQLALSDVHKFHLRMGTSNPQAKSFKEAVEALNAQQYRVLKRLETKGLCTSIERAWYVSGELLERYVADMGGQSRGRIWKSEHDEIFQGAKRLKDLTPLEYNALDFLIRKPYKKHTKDEIIANCWSDVENYAGVDDTALFQMIRQLRLKIEPNPGEPCYIINWRGKPQGGYRFFPEGRPG